MANVLAPIVLILAILEARAQSSIECKPRSSSFVHGTDECICKGGDSFPPNVDGKDITCQIGEACFEGERVRGGNGTDARCEPLVPCTDDIYTPYNGCVRATCTTNKSTPYPQCLIPPCANVDATAPSKFDCKCDTYTCEAGDYCLEGVLDDPDLKTCTRPCEENGSGKSNHLACMCVGISSTSKLEQCGIRKCVDPGHCSTSWGYEHYTLCNDGECFDKYDDGGFGVVPTLLAIFGGVIVFIFIIVFSAMKYDEVQNRRLQREGVFIGLHFSSRCACCCSYRINYGDTPRNVHLLRTHGLSEEEIKEKIEKLNDFLNDPKSELNSPTDGGIGLKKFNAFVWMHHFAYAAVLAISIIGSPKWYLYLSTIPVLWLLSFIVLHLKREQECCFADARRQNWIQRIDTHAKSLFADWLEQGILEAPARFSAVRRQKHTYHVLSLMISTSADVEMSNVMFNINA